MNLLKLQMLKVQIPLFVLLQTKLTLLFAVILKKINPIMIFIQTTLF